jgi:hypothetical protein
MLSSVRSNGHDSVQACPSINAPAENHGVTLLTLDMPAENLLICKRGANLLR